MERKYSKEEIARGLSQLYSRLKKGDDDHVFKGFAFAQEMKALQEAINELNQEEPDDSK